MLQNRDKSELFDATTNESETHRFVDLSIEPRNRVKSRVTFRQQGINFVVQIYLPDNN